MATKFLSIAESMASDGHTQMVARSTLDDVVETSVLTGLPTNMLRPSLEAAGIDLAAQGNGSDSLAAAIARDGNFKHLA
jgi:nitronate monooxygenase